MASESHVLVLYGAERLEISSPVGIDIPSTAVLRASFAPGEAVTSPDVVSKLGSAKQFEYRPASYMTR